MQQLSLVDSKKYEDRKDGICINIPSTLRTIQPFLEDAQKFIRYNMIYIYNWYQLSFNLLTYTI
jgi:hypothetical protein